MSRYDPSNIQHRACLASNILELLVKWGFSIDASFDEHAWEFICVREHRWNPHKKVIIYTSIEKASGAVRENDRDRIRIIRQSVLNEGLHFRRVAKIARVGEFKEIENRVREGIIKAQKQLS
jgi:hypothetical protein